MNIDCKVSQQADCFYKWSKDQSIDNLFFLRGLDMNRNNVTVGCKIPKEYAQRLKEVAEREGISLGELIRRCIELYMSTEE